jgi:hypothetical protein
MAENSRKSPQNPPALAVGRFRLPMATMEKEKDADVNSCSRFSVGSDG